MKRAALFVITFLLLLSFPLQAQTKRLSREAIDSIRNIKVPENGESILAFAVNVVDFGTIYESDSARTFSFQFRNSLNERVVL